MEIELDKKDREGKNNKAEPGDIIQFNNNYGFGVQAIVGVGCVFLLKYTSGNDWMDMARDGGFLDDFKEGDYKILAKSSEWKITWKR